MTTRTVIETKRPQDDLLALCVAPQLVPTLTVRDITSNSLARQAAYDACAARMQCLVWWITSASHTAPPAVCGKD